MPLSNKLGLIACAVLAHCASERAIGAPYLTGASYEKAPLLGVYLHNYPQPSDSRPARTGTAPIQASPSAGETQAGPPPTTGPSGTSGSGPDRYDEVGYAIGQGEGGGNRAVSGAKLDPAAFTAAHHTLPLGSYVEVTALDTGHTILVLVNDRGPAGRDFLIDLSPAAAKALGVNGRAGVRVRRVTPTPDDMAAFRAGQPGSPRLDTPLVLLTALKLRLPGAPTPGAVTPVPTPKAPAKVPTRQSTPTAPVSPAPTRPAPRTISPAKGSYFVQIAAFSSKPRALQLAKTLGGAVSPVGSLWRVRLGPFVSASQAAQARDGAARRGYGDARVVRED